MLPLSSTTTTQRRPRKSKKRAIPHSRLHRSALIALIGFVVGVLTRVVIENIMMEQQSSKHESTPSSIAPSNEVKETTTAASIERIGNSSRSSSRRKRPKSDKRTVIMLICFEYNATLNREKIADLYSYFGEDLFVVTDKNVTDTSLRGDNALMIDGVKTDFPRHLFLTHDMQNVTLWEKLTPQGLGIERAVMWSIDHQHEYDYVWIMEDDIYWTDFDAFAEFLDAYDSSSVDLLHQNADLELQNFTNPNYWHFYFLRYPWVAGRANISAPYHMGMYQLFRLSKELAAKLNEWRILNWEQWTYIEPLLGTLAVQAEGIKTECFMDNPVDYDIHIVYRPCFVPEKIENMYFGEGLYHPVKEGFRACGLGT